MAKIAVVGGGAWGTALAQTAARADNSVIWWMRDTEQASDVRRTRENRRRMPGLTLDRRITIAAAIQDFHAADCILVAVPAQALRELCRLLPTGTSSLVICAKGLERPSGARLSEVARALNPTRRIAVLSGPAFAAEVALEKPSAVTLAAESIEDAAHIAHLLKTPAFRLYPSDDVAGVEIAGAMKNVIAIAAGICMGKELGENARAALITRGLAEIGRLAAAIGGRPTTLLGLAGLGDLMLTATSLTSRNTRLGYELATGGERKNLLGPSHALAEGVWTAGAAMALAAKLKVDLPITDAVDRIVKNEVTIERAIEQLLDRPAPSRE
ncbi:glycerol-3-phosphate dehydrogenase (NAD(P)+) [Arboricoccus pini]|uniref:Glycerol-3-phosphate dehydrogenase [NAD(P)+] n=1 Tax=Arboricoccus pini TaxID=1963835 RepID=A0A212R318_9PROT|nr:NAD(P)H-dependent glycerol-3-phosphate dehydrogenase [Arboricoccus pini]SNB66390.1 glycerol-3-phosphate dehydrogenase (NAD(P)+) [Arboricoccus pini]